MIPTSETLPRLWLARLDAPLPPSSLAWLDDDEHGRLARISHPAVRQARIVAWSLRRWALSHVRPEVGPAEWRFVPGPHGKPEAVARLAACGLHHSLSHGGAYAAVLIADAPCGVDIDAPPPGLEAADVVLSARERAAVLAHSRPADRFLQHWVMKEAALKLLGTGFAVRPEGFELALAPDGASAAEITRRGESPRLPPNTQLHGWPLPDGHRLAAALTRPALLQPAWASWGGVDLAPQPHSNQASRPPV